jgi:hypothetical protein
MNGFRFLQKTAWLAINKAGDVLARRAKNFVPWRLGG